MPGDIQDIFHTLAKLEERVGNMMRVGTVHEVKAASGEQKMRINFGQGSDGNDLLSPWLFSGNHRGSHREETKWNKGQNVMMISPDGNPRQGVIIPYAENDQHLRPEHADDKSNSYQFGRLRESRQGKPPDQKSSGSTSGGNQATEGQQQQENHNTIYEMWFAEEEQSSGGGGNQAEAGGTGTGTQSKRGEGGVKDSEKSVLLFRLGVKEESGGNQAGEGGQGGGDQTKPAMLVRVGKGLKEKAKEDEIVYEAAKRIYFKVGDNWVEITKEGVTVHSASGKIVTDGDTRLGSKNADKLVSGKGTLDTAGDADDHPVAKRVYVEFG